MALTSNDRRMARARRALDIYDTGLTMHENVTDLLTDLMHLMGRADFDMMVRAAKQHYDIERRIP